MKVAPTNDLLVWDEDVTLASDVLFVLCSSLMVGVRLARWYPTEYAQILKCKSKAGKMNHRMIACSERFWGLAFFTPLDTPHKLMNEMKMTVKKNGKRWNGMVMPPFYMGNKNGHCTRESSRIQALPCRILFLAAGI